MTKCTRVLAATAFLVFNLSNAETLRGEHSQTSKDKMDHVKNRLDSLERLVQKHEVTLSMLEETVEEHVQSIAALQNHRNLQGYNETSCELLMVEDSYCALVKHTKMMDDGESMGSATEPVDFVVSGKAVIKDGLEVEAGDCDNCIMFHDDVIFDDNVKFVDPVLFEDPVKFLNDVTIEGMEVPSSKSIKTSDTTYTSLDFKTSEYGKIKFDQDKKFVVTSATRFEKNMDIKLPSSPSSDATEPNLFVEGNLGVAGVIVN